MHGLFVSVTFKMPASKKDSSVVYAVLTLLNSILNIVKWCTQLYGQRKKTTDTSVCACLRIFMRVNVYECWMMCWLCRDKKTWLHSLVSALGSVFKKVGNASCQYFEQKDYFNYKEFVNFLIWAGDSRNSVKYLFGNFFKRICFLAVSK